MIMPGWQSLPSTLRRSPKKAQETWVKAHDSAIDTYGEGARAHRTAYAALKHSFEKVGDRWEPKRRRGPSDKRAARSFASRRGSTRTGVNAESSKKHLYELAKRLDVPGRSTMTKDELASAVDKANKRETARARS